MCDNVAFGKIKCCLIAVIMMVMRLMLREPLNNFILLPMKCIITKVDTLKLAQHIIACLTQWFSDPVKCKLNAD